jgi:magnesium chelatase family protein
MLAKVMSAVLVGIDAIPVEVEADIALGLPTFATVGLPDAAVKESRDRVRSAVKNAGFEFPMKRITVNLAPADVKKEGSAFDLPIAVAILLAEGAFAARESDRWLLVGELSLDGRVKGVRGALSMAVMARTRGFRGVILPEENAAEAAIVEGVEAIGVSTLPQVVEFLAGKQEIRPARVDVGRLFADSSAYGEDLADVRGQEHAKRALEVAAAGGHNLLMIGPPGSGKTMLARRIATVLPEMTFPEAIETTKIHSVAGLLPKESPLIATRPVRSPHHTISDIALIGGGTYPRPGEVSLAHHGVLFLDELPEFKRNALEVLRQPIEEGKVTISRASSSLTFPAAFMLVAALNPCPCGHYTDPSRECVCTPLQIKRYRSRVSGPLMDRIDLHVEVPAVKVRELSGDNDGVEPSSAVRERVNRARRIQQERFSGEGIYCNAQMRPRQMKKHAALDAESRTMLESAMVRLGLSARAYNRILKVSRTIADLDGESRILPSHIAEAIQYRTLDRKSG